METKSITCLLTLLSTFHIITGLTFILEPADGIAAVRRPYWLYCRAEDSSEITYLWQFDNEDIISDPNADIITDKTVYPNGTLQIRSVKEEDIGVYACKASSRGKTIKSRQAILRQAYIAPTFSTNPQDATVKLDSEITLHCRIDSLPSAFIMWRLNGLNIVPEVFFVGTAHYGETLHIGSAGYSDAGEYVCVGVNPLLGVIRYSTPGELQVVGKPQITRPPQNLTSPIGSTVVFNCAALASPEPLLLWFRGFQTGSSVLLQNSSHVFIFSNGTLVVKNIMETDGGPYMCIANNDYGSDRVFAYLEITVAPIIFEAPKNQTVTAGENINFTCEAQGNPTPHVVWLKNGERIKTELTALGVLLLEKVTPSDAGVYTCLAESSEGQISSSVSLNVLFAPEIDWHQADEIVLIGSSFSLSCRITGNPVPSMQWVLPNSMSLQQMSLFENAAVDQTGTLLVTAVMPENQGHYTCYAWNSLGYSTAIALITVEGPPYFKAQPVSQTVLLGKTANLSCQAGSHPTPTVSWFHGDRILLPSSQTVISPLGDLTIHAASLEDEGQYTCVAENSYGKLNTSAILSIHVLPVVVVAPSSMPVTLGQTVSLKCEVTGVPTPTQMWVRSGRTLLLGNNMIMRPDNTLVIANITHKDLGQYTCLARNEAGEKSATASIYLPGWPFFVAVENITANISEPLNISCHAQQSLDGEVVKQAVCWYRGCCNDGNDTQIPCTERSPNINETDSIRVWSTNHGDLYFQQVLEADEGWYYCGADNEGDAVYSDPVFISVQVSPRITNVTIITPENNQTSLQIVCLAVGNPDPLVIWRSPIGQEVRGEKTDLADGVQSVVKVTDVSDSGQWICKACNILGCDSATITVNVEGSPIIVNVLSESSDVHVTITCQVVGFPFPDIYYYISNGTDVTNLPSHTVEAGHLMVMANVLQEAYTCTAKNIHGASSLLLTKPLTHPWIIHTVSSATEISLTFNISGSLGSLPLKALLIAYRPLLKEAWAVRTVPVHSFNTFNSSGTGQTQGSSLLDHGVMQSEDGIAEIELSLLMPFTMYEIKTQLVNDLGTGPPSKDSLHVLTSSDVPSQPTSVRIDTCNRSATVSWSPPERLNGDSGFIVYLIQLLDGWATLLAQLSVPSAHERNASFHNLSLGNYSVSLMAMNVLVEGVSKAVTTAFVITYEVPDYVPTILLAEAISNDTVSVTWQVPDNPMVLYPPVEGYVVNISSSGPNTSILLRVNASNISTAKAEGLHQRMEYTVRVAAFNGRGIGPYSTSVLTQYGKDSASAACTMYNLPLLGMLTAVTCGCIGAGGWGVFHL